jgi:hypothetical protein
LARLTDVILPDTLAYLSPVEKWRTRHSAVYTLIKLCERHFALAANTTGLTSIFSGLVDRVLALAAGCSSSANTKSECCLIGVNVMMSKFAREHCNASAAGAVINAAVEVSLAASALMSL